MKWIKSIMVNKILDYTVIANNALMIQVATITLGILKSISVLSLTNRLFLTKQPNYMENKFYVNMRQSCSTQPMGLILPEISKGLMGHTVQPSNFWVGTLCEEQTRGISPRGSVLTGLTVMKNFLFIQSKPASKMIESGQLFCLQVGCCVCQDDTYLQIRACEASHHKFGSTGLWQQAVDESPKNMERASILPSEAIHLIYRNSMGIHQNVLLEFNNISPNEILA